MDWKRIYTNGYAFKVPYPITTIDVLVVGGGGGCGSGNTNVNANGGGGGAGGLIFIENYSVVPYDIFEVVVGSGGTWYWNIYVPGANGEDSKFGTLIAKGGGGGGGASCAASDGGSGGGAGRSFNIKGEEIQSLQSGSSGLYGFGHDGGPALASFEAGGGGGAGGAGTSGRAGEGMGPGKEIWGTTYAIGGSGGPCQTYNIPNTGNGGAGSGKPQVNPGHGGCSGVVLIKCGEHFYRFIGETWSSKMYKKDDVVLYNNDSYIALRDTYQEPIGVPIKGRRAGFINFF